MIFKWLFVLFSKWQDNQSILDVVLSVAILLWAFAFNLLMCEPGQRVTNQYARIGDELSTCDWHLFPIQLQRLYLIFFMNTQQPVHIQCFSGITSSRETLKKVIFNLTYKM